MRLVLIAAAILLTSLGGALAQTDLPKSKLCRIRGGGFAVAGGVPLANTITMINDGGWCGHLAKTVMGSIVFGAAMHVTKPPAHGQVSITVLSGGTNVYYRPDPGYVGSDSFSVLNEMYNIDRPYNVIVQQ